MRHVPIAGRHGVNMERARRALRISVGKGCERRPPGSESLGADAARTCEPQCKLFLHLPQLVQTAECLDPMLASLPRVMTRSIDDVCAAPAGARACHAAPAEECPLSKYRRRVIRALERVVAN